VGNGDAAPHILLPCVRERVPSTDIVEVGTSKTGVAAVEKRKLFFFFWELCLSTLSCTLQPSLPDWS